MPLKEIKEILKIHLKNLNKHQKNSLKTEISFNDSVVSLVENLSSPLNLECIKDLFLLVHAKFEDQLDILLEIKFYTLIYNEFVSVCKN